MTATAKHIDRIITRLRNLPDGTDLFLLERIIQSFEHPARSNCVGFFGPSGSGKSTLMNRILGVEILPAYSSGQLCTNVIIKISPKAEQDGQFEIIIDYFDNGELTKLLQFKAPSAEEDTEDIEDDTEESEDYLVAQEILKALWDDEEDSIPLHPQYVLDLLPPRLQADFRQRGRRVVKRFSNPAEVSDYLEQVNDQEKIPYLIKNIEVRGYFEGLDAQICLLNIPGSGDTKFLNNLQRQGLDQSDLVVFVEKQARVRNEDVMRRLGKYSDRFERKVGFAFCMTGAGEGLIDHCKKRMRRDPAAGADQGDEYVENQKELFKAKVEKVDRGTLSRKLAGMEVFMLENKGDDEPEFSKAERAKFNEFLRRPAKTNT
ncbi:hypothetical protein BASA81_004859 [Batrachochytrium salamandrivorans]|nr:hypothetical protein BASA81_004859 [Batrachochytrium salamandrivorans]